MTIKRRSKKNGKNTNLIRKSIVVDINKLNAIKDLDSSINFSLLIDDLLKKYILNTKRQNKRVENDL